MTAWLRYHEPDYGRPRTRNIITLTFFHASSTRSLFGVTRQKQSDAMTRRSLSTRRNSSLGVKWTKSSSFECKRIVIDSDPGDLVKMYETIHNFMEARVSTAGEEGTLTITVVKPTNIKYDPVLFLQPGASRFWRYFLRQWKFVSTCECIHLKLGSSRVRKRS